MIESAARALGFSCVVTLLESANLAFACLSPAVLLSDEGYYLINRNYLIVDDFIGMHVFSGMSVMSTYCMDR